MDKQFHPTLHWARDYLSMLGLKLIHVSKGAPGISWDIWVRSRNCDCLVTWFCYQLGPTHNCQATRQGYSYAKYSDITRALRCFISPATRLFVPVCSALTRPWSPVIIHTHWQTHMQVKHTCTLSWLYLYGSVCHIFSSVRDDVIIWKHFPRYWSFVRGIHRSQLNSPHKGQ